MDRKKVTVFLASPGDLEPERLAIEETISKLNEGFGDGKGVEFICSGWEKVLSSVGVRSQDVINQRVDRCDVFILMLHAKWGQEASDSDYSSYTEEEFHRALQRYESSGEPTIYVFFKTINRAQESDPGPQLEKVLAFKKSLEKTKTVLYKQFNSTDDLVKLTDKHLRGYACGDIPASYNTTVKTPLPLSAIAEIEKAKAIASAALKKQDKLYKDLFAGVNRSSELTLYLAEIATHAAIEGNIDKARQQFAKVVSGGANLAAYHAAVHFYINVGDFIAANSVLDRLEKISSIDELEQARLCIGRSDIHSMQGNYTASEKKIRKAVALCRPLDNEELLADSLCRLGTVLGSQNKCDESLTVYLESLSIFEKLGMGEKCASVKNSCANIMLLNNQISLAERYAKDALKYYEDADLKKGIEDVYGNLSLIYSRKEKPKQAIEMLEKALELHLKYDDKIGIAADYNNLGKNYSALGDHGKSIGMHEKSLEVNRALPRVPNIVVNLAHLGIEYMYLDNMPIAEKYFKEAISYNFTNGVEDIIAIVNTNLNEIRRIRNEAGIV